MNESQLDLPSDKSSFLSRLIVPRVISENVLVPNKNQVAGHAGFFQIKEQSELCLKPFNLRCVRGRREHLFYQLLEYFKHNTTDNKEKSNATFHHNSEMVEQKGEFSLSQNLHYHAFKLLTHPARKCDCKIDSAIFESLSPYVAKFHHVKSLGTKEDSSDSSDCQNATKIAQFRDLVYSDDTTCPCYGLNPIEKISCARDYPKINFLCLEDLTSHCHEPCILDIKIGQITYDPIAVKEKVLEQSTKYKRLREFGFRILGMKLGNHIKDKSFGKALESGVQVLDALASFLDPLSCDDDKLIVIRKILERLRGLLQWFETENISQLKFFSSSLLIVYDSFHRHTKGSSLADSVRVSMIDFAHVFHVHKVATMISSTDDGDKTIDRDENYIYGLKKLIEFFAELDLKWNGKV